MKKYVKPMIEVNEFLLDESILVSSGPKQYYTQGTSQQSQQSRPKTVLTQYNVSDFGKVVGNDKSGKPIYDITEGLRYIDSKRGKREYETGIAGLQYRCTPDDVGTIAGWIIVETSNQYSQNARAVYDVTGKHLGYVPKDTLSAFSKWAGDYVIPFIGSIEYGDDYDMNTGKTSKCFFSYIKAFKPYDKESLISDMKECAWFVRRQFKQPMSKYSLTFFSEEEYQTKVEEERKKQEEERKALEEERKAKRREKDRERRAKMKAEKENQNN